MEKGESATPEVLFRGARGSASIHHPLKCLKGEWPAFLCPLFDALLIAICPTGISRAADHKCCGRDAAGYHRQLVQEGPIIMQRPDAHCGTLPVSW